MLKALKLYKLRRLGETLCYYDARVAALTKLVELELGKGKLVLNIMDIDRDFVNASAKLAVHRSRYEMYKKRVSRSLGGT